MWLWSHQEHTPWPCWRNWSLGTSTWSRSLRPTRLATVRSPTLWSCCLLVAARTATRTPGIPTHTQTPQVKRHEHTLILNICKCNLSIKLTFKLLICMGLGERLFSRFLSSWFSSVLKWSLPHWPEVYDRDYCGCEHRPGLHRHVCLNPH